MAEQLAEMVNRQREHRQTPQELASSSQKEKETEEHNGTELKPQNGHVITAETKKQIRQSKIRQKYAEMEIDDPEGWNWPEGPRNAKVPTFLGKAIQHAVQPNEKPSPQLYESA